MVEGRDPRGLALRRGDRLRRGRPPPPGRFAAPHPAHERRRQDLDAIARGIPAGSYVNVVREDPERRGLLYAGTETGVFVSFDDGDHWQPLQGNLPELLRARHLGPPRRPRHRDARPLLLGARRPTPLRQMDASVTQADAWLFAPRDGRPPSPGRLSGNALPERRAGGGEPSVRRHRQLRAENRVLDAGDHRDPGRQGRPRAPLRVRRPTASPGSAENPDDPRLGRRRGAALLLGGHAPPHMGPALRRRGGTSRLPLLRIRRPLGSSRPIHRPPDGRRPHAHAASHPPERPPHPGHRRRPRPPIRAQPTDRSRARPPRRRVEDVLDEIRKQLAALRPKDVRQVWRPTSRLSRRNSTRSPARRLRPPKKIAKSPAPPTACAASDLWSQLSRAIESADAAPTPDALSGFHRRQATPTTTPLELAVAPQTDLPT